MKKAEYFPEPNEVGFVPRPNQTDSISNKSPKVIVCKIFVSNLYFKSLIRHCISVFANDSRALHLQNYHWSN